jgi:hypothetical protein
MSAMVAFTLLTSELSFLTARHPLVPPGDRDDVVTSTSTSTSTACSVVALRFRRTPKRLRQSE